MFTGLMRTSDLEISKIGEHQQDPRRLSCVSVQAFTLARDMSANNSCRRTMIVLSAFDISIPERKSFSTQC